jgi:hypothetical protein
MRRLWYAYPLFLLTLVPGLKQLFELGYRSFARNRRAISKTCGWEPLIPPGAGR